MTLIPSTVTAQVVDPKTNDELKLKLKDTEWMEYLLIQEKVLREMHSDAKGYKAQILRKEYSHKMSDGGVTTYFINDNYQADIRLKYVSQTVYNSLKSLFDEKTSFTFVPFPTATSWEANFSVARIYEVNWIKSFDFESYTKNQTDLGHSGTIRLRETPK